VFIDQRWIARYGIEPDAGGLTFDDWLERIHPDDRESAAEVRERHLTGQSPHYESEYRVVTPDGVRWVQIRGSVVARAAEGTALRVSGTILDVTDRKQLEAQFLRAQRLESIGTLAGGIAHDLNNVLTPIMMATDLLRMQARDDAQMLTTVQMIEESATRGANMIKQVLSFARGYEGSPVELQPAHVLREMSRIVRETFPRTITVETAWPRDLWTVLADPTQIHQVLMNLCVNARDAMPGGGHLTLRADNVVLDEAAAAQIPDARPGRYVMLTVGDTGVGIPDSDRHRIFEPFYTTKEPGSGTGLGLSTALAIVRSHGGLIDFTSNPERGATFRIHLPALDQPGLAAGESANTLIPRGHGELVLVVDDEPSIRAICRRTLEAFGYRVVTATDGAEAIAVYAQQRGEVRAVLLDMMMPIMDGPSAARALLRMNPQLPIIGGSGLAEESMAPRAAAAGVQSFLPKPYSTEGLLQTVARVLT
jgi:signal transduction histidine kinase/CheY-like chemotaxis protein